MKIQVDEIKDTEPFETLKRAELLTMLINWDKIAWSGVNFMNCQYFTNHSFSRTVNKKKVLQKLTTTRISAGADYTTKINKLLKKQGDDPNFVSEELKGKTRKWGNNVPLCVSNRDENFVMLCVVVENHVVPFSQYYHEGQVISKEVAIEKDLFAPAYFNKQKTVGRGLVDEELNFHYRTIGLDKFTKIKINGKLFKIVD